jgi:hypothetical protein
MPVKLNSEFNYRYQVEGNTPWEKIKHLKSFLEGRKRAAVLERVSELKYQALVAEIEYLKENGGLKHIILQKEAELLETDSFRITQEEAFELNRQEIEILEKLLAELYVEVEPTRLLGYTDEQMFELNAANEFTAMIGKEIYAEIAANGRPSPAKIRNAMSNPYTMNALKQVGLIHPSIQYLKPNADPLKIELHQVIYDQLDAPKEEILKLQMDVPDDNNNSSSN